MKLWKTILFREIGVPKANNLEYVELSSQIATHPSVSKVHEIDIELVQVWEDPSIGLLDKFLHFIDNLMHPWLIVCVVVLDVVNELTQAPEYVSLYIDQLLSTDLFNVLLINFIDVVLVQMRENLR